MNAARRRAAATTAVVAVLVAAATLLLRVDSRREGVRVAPRAASAVGPSSARDGDAATELRAVAPVLPRSCDEDDAERPRTTDTLPVRVVDAADGSAVVGAVVGWVDEHGLESVGTARTDAHGLCTIRPGHRGSPGFVVVAARGYRPAEWRMGGSERATTGSPVELLMRLDPGVRLSGRTMDEGGRPVGGAEVWVGPAGHGGGAWPFDDGAVPRAAMASGGRTTSDDDGRFELEGLDATQAYALVARRRGYVTVNDDQLTRCVPGACEVVVRLAPTARLHISVVDDETSEPVPSATWQVDLDGPGDLLWPERMVSAMAHHEASSAGGWDVGWVRRSASPAPEGDLPLAVDVTVAAAGYLPRSVATTVAWTSSGRQVIRLSRRSAAATSSVPVRARFAEGAVWVGWLGLEITDEHGTRGVAVLRLERAADEPRLTLAEGTYRVRPIGVGPSADTWIPAGPEVLLTASGGSAAPRTLDLVLEGSALRLDVVDSSGRPVRGFDVGVRAASASTWWSTWDFRVHAGRRWPTAQDDDRVDPSDGPLLWVPRGAVRVAVVAPWGARAEASAHGDLTGRVQDLRIVVPGR